MMQLNLDDHLEDQAVWERVHDDGTREVTPALAHYRAGDRSYVALVPACPLCEATITSQREAWAALHDAAKAINEENAAKAARGLTDGTPEA